MVDWLNPTREMEAGREAGRQDRDREVEELQEQLADLQERIRSAIVQLEGCNIEGAMAMLKD